MAIRKKKSPISVFLLITFLVVMGSPFYVMFIGGFKSNKELLMLPPDMGPFTGLVNTNLLHVVFNSEIFLWITNSFVVSISVAGGTMFIAAMAGYAFSKLDFKFKNLLFAIIIATMILPRQILLIPNFLVAMNLGLVNSLIGVILTSIVPAFGIFLCRQFMLTIPRELTEAAEIDGCSEMGKFFRIIVPISMPALGAVGIFSFFTTFNDYLWQLVMISDKNLQTVPIGIAMFMQKATANIGYQLMAASVATVPLLVIFIFCQRFFIKGITMGGVKG